MKTTCSESEDTKLAAASLPEPFGRAGGTPGVCIADEGQTGFGRPGPHFWGFETQAVIPDLVTMAKGIGNGCRLAAVVTTERSRRRWSAKFIATRSAETRLGRQ